MTESPANGFSAVPNWMIRDESFGIYDIAVYAALASHAGAGGIFPSQRTLAAEARCSPRKVVDVLKELERRGVVQVVTRRRKGGGSGRENSLTNGYVLVPDGPLADDECDTTDRVARGALHSGTEVHATTDRSAPDDRPKCTGGNSLLFIEEEPIEEEPVRGYPFDDFYAVYPRKVGKVEAMRAFAKAARSTDPMVIVAGARRFAADPNLPPKRFIPNPSTWLNRGSWDDEPLPEREDAPAAAGTGDWMNQ